MKRKNLHLGLVLITISLGLFAMSFSSFTNGKNAAVIGGDESSVVAKIKSSSDYLAMLRANQSSGVITHDDYSKVQEQLASFAASRVDSPINWSQLGPDNFGGRTRALLFDNQNADATVLYGAGITGGIWKTVNTGVTWKKVNKNSSNLNVSCMAQNMDGHIYVGTGEMFDAEMYSGLDEMGYTTGFVGQGIFKSTDGDNFQLLTSTAPTFNDINSDWAFINELAVNSNGALFAATNTGLKYSNDDGASWVTVSDTGGTALTANALDVKVSSTGSVIAAVGNECYLSQNGNVNSFVLKSTGDSISLPLAVDVRRIEFAFAPSDVNIIYASVVDKFGSVYNIYLSEDQGATWRVILPGTPAVVIFNGLGIYDNVIQVFPTDPGRVLLGGADLWQGRKIQETGFYSWVRVSESFTNPFSPSYLHLSQHAVAFRPGYNDTFFVGNDGGISIGSVTGEDYRFEGSNRNYITTQFYNIAPSGRENYVLGGAQGNGSILISGEGNTNLQGETVFGGNGGACALSLIDKNVMVVSSAGASFQRSENAGFTFSNQFLGDFSPSTSFFNTPIALWESFDNPNSRDSMYYHARTAIAGGTRVQVMSENSGQPFYYTTPLDVDLKFGDSINVCDVVSSRLFIASDNIVGMTKDLHRFDTMPEWFTIANTSVNFIGDPQCVAYSSDANHLFVGMRDGRVYRISNLALAYDYEHADVNSTSCIVSTQEIPLVIPGTTTPITQVVTSIAVDQENPNNIIVTLGNYGNAHYVLMSENALDEFPVFASKQGNLPQMPVYSSLLEMSDPNLAIIGTEHGIFINENIHSTSSQWIKQDSMMGSVPVFQLQQQTVSKMADTVILVNGNETIEIVYPGTNNYGIIYAATFGRGLMRSNTFRKPVAIQENEPNPIAVESLRIYPNPVVSNATIELDVAKAGIIDISIYDLMGRQVGYHSESVTKGHNKLSLNLTGLPTGSYVISAITGDKRYSQKFIVN